STANRSAVARPMPAAPPVTITTLSFRLRSNSIHPPQSQLNLARRQRRQELPEVRIRHECRLRIGDRRSAQILAARDRLHIEVLLVRQIETLGDRVELSEWEREALRHAQRKLSEMRAVHR